LHPLWISLDAFCVYLLSMRYAGIVVMAKLPSASSFSSSRFSSSLKLPSVQEGFVPMCERELGTAVELGIELVVAGALGAE